MWDILEDLWPLWRPGERVVDWKILGGEWKKKLSEKEAAEATYVPKDLSVRKPCRKLLLEAGICEREHQFQSIFLKFHCAEFFSTFFFPEVHHHWCKQLKSWRRPVPFSAVESTSKVGGQEKKLLFGKIISRVLFFGSFLCLLGELRKEKRKLTTLQLSELLASICSPLSTD